VTPTLVDPLAHFTKGEGERAAGGVSRASPADEGQAKRERLLACAECRRPITTEEARVEIDGSHGHTFANPYGFAYHIGCFATAAGLVAVGPPSTEFAWFAGHTWQIQECAGCRTHLGWLFWGPGRRFYGLVLERLIEIDEPAAS
jgi:hypothetical protein